MARGKGGAVPPSWAAVLICISLFVVQYWLSGELDQRLHPAGAEAAVVSEPLNLTIDATLAVFAALHFYAFDRTPQGLFMSALTAICGPLIEITLINQFQLYQYTHPHFLGVPSWIPEVYWCGGPAVGLLGRRVFADLQELQKADEA